MVSERIEASADTKRNTYTHWCEPMQQRRHYAVCLNIIHRVEAGEKLPSDRQDCVKAITNGTCPADLMRDAEVGAGKAIHFVERMRGEELIKHQADRYVPTVRQKPATKIVSSKQSDALDLQNDHVGGFEQVVNKLAQEKTVSYIAAIDTAGNVGKVEVLPKVDFLPGETPLQAARRRAAFNSQTKE